MAGKRPGRLLQTIVDALSIPLPLSQSVFSRVKLANTKHIFLGTDTVAPAAQNRHVPMIALPVSQAQHFCTDRVWSPVRGEAA